MGLIKNIFSSWLHFLAPELCVSCGLERIDREVGCCVFCSDSLKPFYPEKLESQVFLNGERDIALYIGFIFQKNNPIQTLLHALKYQGNFQIARFLADQLSKRYYEEIQQVEGFIAVPIHVRKRFDRGYNQCALMVNHLCQQFNKNSYSTLLQKVVNNASQTKKNKEERRLNVENSYWVSPKIKQFSHLGIVEDVLTTGATLRAITQEIKRINPTIKLSFFVVASALECTKKS